MAACRPFSSSSISNSGNTPDIRIVEVGPRDGLQNESAATAVTLKQKLAFIQQLADAGCQNIEVGSFVDPKKVPAMADTRMILEKLRQNPLPTEPTLACLVPNLKGWQQARRCAAVDEISFFVSATEGFSQHNIGCSVDESLKRLQTIVTHQGTQREGERQFPIRGYVSCVIACPYDGPTNPTQVARVVEQLLELGCYEISLGDTIGVGTPETFEQMLKEVVQVVGDPSTQLAVHCHDTNGHALANISLALDKFDIRTIDASVAGLGGCPYAPGASGNVATEDVVDMLHGMGLSTGVDLDKLVDTGDYICKILQRPTQSKVAQAILARRQQK